MMLTRLLLAFSLLGALAVACGGGGDGDGRALTLEEYMQRMEEIDGEAGRKLEEDVFGAENPSAEEGGRAYAKVVDDAKEKYRNVTPPLLVDAAHDEVREAVDEFGDALDEAADNAEEGARLSDLLAQEEVVSAEERLNDALCAVQQMADDNQIAADVGCN
jgi:hypothetical protein